jgi:hypothetical protein
MLFSLAMATSLLWQRNLSDYSSAPVLSPLEGSDGKLYIANEGGGKFGLGAGNVGSRILNARTEVD